jgi:hypothetical protein
LTAHAVRREPGRGRVGCTKPAIGRIHCLSTEQNKLLVRRLVDEAVGRRNVDAIDELAADEFAQVAVAFATAS